MSRKPLDEWIFDRVMPIPMAGCWIWMTALNSKGYGQTGIYHIEGRAHRLSWHVFRGAIPDGLQVLHKCDVRPCVNPDHLFLGTNADNMRDKTQKGRATGCRGVDAYQAKLTEAQVLDILKRRMSVTNYARLYGVAQSTISLILNGRKWRHLSQPNIGR